MTGSYWDSLSDIVSPAVLDAAYKAGIASTHGEATGETGLQVEVRAIVLAIRAEERARAEQEITAGTQQIRDHYDHMTKRLQEGIAHRQAELRRASERAIAGYRYATDLVLDGRRRGVKTVKLAALAQAVGVPLDDWHADVEPQPGGTP